MNVNLNVAMCCKWISLFIEKRGSAGQEEYSSTRTRAPVIKSITIQNGHPPLATLFTLFTF